MHNLGFVPWGRGFEELCWLGQVLFVVLLWSQCKQSKYPMSSIRRICIQVLWNKWWLLLYLTDAVALAVFFESRVANALLLVFMKGRIRSTFTGIFTRSGVEALSFAALVWFETRVYSCKISMRLLTNTYGRRTRVCLMNSLPHSRKLVHPNAKRHYYRRCRHEILVLYWRKCP